MSMNERDRVVAYLSREILKACEQADTYQKIAENERLSQKTREQMAQLAIREIFFAAAYERLMNKVRAGDLADFVIPDDE